jgi:hypothetical protein
VHDDVDEALGHIVRANQLLLLVQLDEPVNVRETCNDES